MASGELHEPYEPHVMRKCIVRNHGNGLPASATRRPLPGQATACQTHPPPKGTSAPFT